MRELERLNAENAELRSLLAQANAVLETIVSMTTEIVVAIQQVGKTLEAIDPRVAEQAAVASKNWSEFIASVEVAKATAALQNAPATDARN